VLKNKMTLIMKKIPCNYKLQGIFLFYKWVSLFY